MNVSVNSVVISYETGNKYLILWLSPDGEYGYWYNLSSSSRVPLRFICSEITTDGFEISVFEPMREIQPEAMLSDKERSVRDSNWAIIREAVEFEPDIYEKQLRFAILEKVADKYSLKVPNLYYLLDKYWRAGKSKNGLIPNYSKRGTKLAKTQSGSKPGVKPGSTGTVGKALTDNDHSNFEKVIQKYYLNQQKRGLKSTYEKLLQDYYTRTTENGKLKLLEPSELPSLRQFRYWYGKNRDVVTESKKRGGERYFDLNKRAVTGKSDYGLMGPGAQFQVDATVGDVYLVSQFDRSNLVGRPIIYFIIDAFSRMVVGMGVGLEGPSWNALADALINMATDKVAYCGKYGIEISENEWPCHYVPASLLGDRGELESKNADALATMLGIRVINAPPYRADLKGIIEQHFRTININAVSQLPGSVKPDMQKRGGHDYRLDAMLDINQLTKILIKCVLYYNNYHYLESFEKSEAMMASRVKAIPAKLWGWGIKNYSGALRSYSEDVVKFAVLPTANASVTAKGIRFKGLLYTCERAKFENWFEKARGAKTWTITVAYDSRDMANIHIWNADAKQYETCYLLDWNSKYAGKTLMEVVDEQQRERAEGQRLKIAETEAKVNLNAEIEAIIAEAEDMGKSTVTKSKSERVSQIRENRANERKTMRSSNINAEANSDPNLPQMAKEPEISPVLQMIKAKVEEQLKNDRTKSNL